MNNNKEIHQIIDKIRQIQRDRLATDYVDAQWDSELADFAIFLANHVEPRLRDFEFAIQSAINELQSWQYANDIENVRRSIDAAIRALQRP